MDLLDELGGTWHIAATTFPMWLNGKCTDATFTYTRRGDVLEDDVAFRSGGRTKHILGVDTPTGPASFEWRGNGLMRVLTSQWQVTHLAEDRSWAVIEFAKTLFTPAGVDGIARHATLDERAWTQVESELEHRGHPSVRRLGS